ncbi:MAG: metallophosphoesterase family protein [Desulfurococcales archaeon]|nr:metallophosphoesterase family protein [Desulfurococcales archaeon]
MRVLAVSDVHYEFKVYRGVDESVAWGWLLRIVDSHKPDLLVSAGDWGEALNPRDLEDLLERTVVLTIYGNHDPLEVLAGARNKLARLPVLLRDGKPLAHQGLWIGGINGITSMSGRPKRGIPRKTPSEFLEAAKVLVMPGRRLDVLLMHEVPALKFLYPRLRVGKGQVAALEALRAIKPRVVVNGHLDWSCYTLHTLEWGDGLETLYLRVDSSQIHKCYAIMDFEKGVVTVYRDMEVLEEASIP